MKPLIVILAICSLGYAVDHWQDLKERHSLAAAPDAPGLILYSSKAIPACVQLEAELKKRGISFQRRDMGDEANSRKLTEDLARVGKMGGSIPMPVAEVDGALIEGATLKEIQHRLR
ncbi:MAG: hypothetical protein P4L99_18030 [Chthoniobacter sp.]|nr:hypothetical protein [Chthoniobacter sp.]